MPFGKGQDAKEAGRKGAEKRWGPKLPAATDGAPVPVVPDDVSLLAAMRHVFCRPTAEDVTEQHHFCRRWMAENPHGFGSKLADLEAKYGKISPAGEGEAQEQDVKDEGTDAALALCRRLLTECGP